MAHYDWSYKNDTLDIQCTVHQYNIIVDVLGGWSRTMEEGLWKLLGKKKHAEVGSVKYVEYCKGV